MEHECERFDDPWLREAQEEIRCGNLSADNHAFLHGMPTSVPGSWCKGKALCGKVRCQTLGEKGKQKARLKSAISAAKIAKLENSLR